MGNAYSKFRGANVMGVRKYIEAGDHILLIKRITQGMSSHPKRQGQEKTIVEFKIIASDNEAEMKIGNACSLVEVDASQGYLGNVLSFVAGVMGCSIDDMNADEDFEQVFDSVFGANQVFTGQLVRCIAQKVPTTSPDAKSPVYTAKSWEPVLASDYEGFGCVAPQGAYTGDDDEAEGGEDAGAQAAA